MQLGFDELKRLGVVLKRAAYFITCKGRMMYPVRIEENAITNHLIYDDRRKLLEIQGGNEFRQLNLFDDYNVNVPPTIEEKKGAVFGEM